MNSLAMPKVDRKLVARKNDIVSDLKKIIKSENVLHHEDELRPFETDALSAYKQKPLIVIFPENTKIDGGDVIIGKAVPINLKKKDTNYQKKFRDNSSKFRNFYVYEKFSLGCFVYFFFVSV